MSADDDRRRDDEDQMEGNGGAETATGGGMGSRQTETYEELDDYAGWQVMVSTAVAIVVTGVAVWWARGYGGSFEALFRIAPTATGANRGVGAEWVAGNTEPVLDFAIAFIHAMDVIMGLFLLFLVFVHWSAFRRFADRMQQPSDRRESAVATDGGLTAGEGTSGASSDGGERVGESRVSSDDGSDGGDETTTGGERR